LKLTTILAGHFSASDRYKFLKEKGFQYAFLLEHLGLLHSVEPHRGQSQRQSQSLSQPVPVDGGKSNL
jgi:hypothetical protein